MDTIALVLCLVAIPGLQARQASELTPTVVESASIYGTCEGVLFRFVCVFLLRLYPTCYLRR